MDVAQLNLLPKPARIEFTGGEISLNEIPVREWIDPTGPGQPGEEAYRLVAHADYIHLCAHTEKGLRWGRATLGQLRKHPVVPALIIEDAPLFKHRGVMLDISRDRVPALRTLFELVDLLASWKMNHFQLYVEHTLAYAGHEEVWQAASPIRMEELSALDAYCRDRGIELCANQNSLGHFERWLKHPRYAPLAELDHGHMVRGDWYVRPNTLCPGDPRVQPLLCDLLSQQLSRCSGAYANIGCDEPWDLGLGRSRERCEREGKGKVFSQHVRSVAEMVQSLGRKPMYWCDPEPHEDDGLPRDLVALVWGYEGVDDMHGRAAAHLAVNREVWVAPGTSCWNSFTGRTWNRRANLDHAVRTRGANGLLCTVWGDGGHRQPYPITLFGLADAAMAAWSGSGHYNDAAVGLHAFDCAEVGPWLARLGNVDAELCLGERPGWDGSVANGHRVHNATAMWKELSAHLLEPDGIGDSGAWEEVKARLIALRADLPQTLAPLLAAECSFSVDMSEWIVDRAIVRRGSLIQSQRKDLAVRMAELIEIHRHQWLQRCRYGGLEDSTARFSAHAIQW